MKKIIILGAVIVVVIALAFTFYKKNKTEEITYVDHVVTKGNISTTILATGTVQPKNRLEIKAPISGRIDQVLIKEGSKVKKGQIIAWMSSTERAAMLDAARSKGESEYKKWSELYLPTPVLAPISGTIILKNVEPGQTFTSTDAIFTMSDHLTVKAQVDETDIAKIKLNSKAIIILDAYPGSSINAHVDQLAFDATTTNNVTTYAIDVLPDETPAFMRSGMTANVTFLVEEKTDVLYVPADAIKVTNGSSFVLVRGSEKKPIQSPVTTGITDGKKIEIQSGLKENDIILIQNYSIGGEGKSSTNPFGINLPRGPGRR